MLCACPRQWRGCDGRQKGGCSLTFRIVHHQQTCSRRGGGEVLGDLLHCESHYTICPPPTPSILQKKSGFHFQILFLFIWLVNTPAKYSEAGDRPLCLSVPALLALCNPEAHHLLTACAWTAHAVCSLVQDELPSCVSRVCFGAWVVYQAQHTGRAFVL